MDGVLQSTLPVEKKVVPTLKPSGKKGKTDSVMGFGIPYAGPKSGYGKA